MRRVFAIGMFVAIGALLVFVLNTNLLPFGSFPQRQIGDNIENSIGRQILENAPQETGAANVVTSVVWGYRGYDTLGESTVLFTAVVGVLMVFRTLGRHERMVGMTVIVRTISRLLFPFVVLFGIYVVLHGHLTSGGGFPGGVIIAAAIVMLILAYGIERAQKKVSFLHAEVLDGIGGITIVVLGLFGILFATYFLQNVFPMGGLGQLFSAGNLSLLYLGVGVKVTAGILLIFYAMLIASRGEKK